MAFVEINVIDAWFGCLAARKFLLSHARAGQRAGA
jgi:hypothetical protein